MILCNIYLIDSRSKINNKVLFFMSCSVTSVFTFKIESTFDEWAAIFDMQKQIRGIQNLIFKPLSEESARKILKKLLLFIKRQKATFKSLWRQMVTGWQLIELTDNNGGISWTASLTKKFAVIKNETSIVAALIVSY